MLGCFSWLLLHKDAANRDFKTHQNKTKQKTTHALTSDYACDKDADFGQVKTLTDLLSSKLAFFPTVLRLITLSKKRYCKTMTHTLLVILELVWKIGFRIWWRNVCNLKGYLFSQRLPKLLKVIITKALQSVLSSSTDHHLSLSHHVCICLFFEHRLLVSVPLLAHLQSIHRLLSRCNKTLPVTRYQIIPVLWQRCSDLVVIFTNATSLSFVSLCFPTYVFSLYMKWSDFPSCTLSLLWLLNCCTFILPRSRSGVQHSEKKKNNPKT